MIVIMALGSKFSTLALLVVEAEKQMADIHYSFASSAFSISFDNIYLVNFNSL